MGRRAERRGASDGDRAGWRAGGRNSPRRMKARHGRRKASGCSRTSEEFNLPRAQFEELVDGVEMDLRHVRYETFADLVEYCRRVASAVGLICLEIFGYRNQAARAYAENLGLALQLTNIIRDVSADIVRGRIYLPTEDLRTIRRQRRRSSRRSPDIAGRGAAAFRVRSRAQLLSPRGRTVAAARMGAASWRPRSWAASISRSCGASSARVTTSSARVSGCRVRSAQSLRCGCGSRRCSEFRMQTFKMQRER